MDFNVTIQGRFYKTLTAANTTEVLRQITHDIAAGLVPEFDQNAPHNISIKAPTVDPFDQWKSVAPQNPKRFDVWLAPDESEWIYDQPRAENGRYLADNPDTPEKESALQWVPHTEFNAT